MSVLVDLVYTKEDVSFRFSQRKAILRALAFLQKDYGLDTLNLSLVFASDPYLKAINKQYLKHDYDTDIITFELSDTPYRVFGELFISVDRVKENSNLFNVSFSNELCRVIIHGVLHLVGLNDSTEKEKKIMRNMEEKYLGLGDCFM